MSDGGKGSRPRPFSIDRDEWNKRWDLIFGRDLDEDKDSSDKDSSETDSAKIVDTK